ncbi:DUF3570 domain-containing protein [Thalassolituus sp.]|uniref:DUF3570 domain-containing protein n=1 Tax=Thalassolituus sp. TaxID=2030822 RepID=UPI0035114EA9
MLLIRALIFWLISAMALAEGQIPSADELDSIFAFRGVIYQQEDGAGGKGGNPDLEEDATIYEGIWLYQHRLNDSQAATLRFTGDLVTAASYDDAREKAETVSQATGYNPGRFNFELGWKYRFYDQFGFGLHASYGQEYAYRSTGYGLSLSQSFAEESTYIAAQFQVFDDTVRMIRFDGSKEPDEPRRTYSGTLSWTQTLTPLSVMSMSWSHSEQNGMLATSFNSVVSGTERVFETTPDVRVRDTISVRLKQALQQNSVQLGLSYYEDNWDIRAAVAEVRYFYHLDSGRLILEPSYRYYHQDGAYFYTAALDAPERFRSSDPDLGNFDGHSAGLLLSAWQAGWFTQSLTRYDIGVNYYRRSDDLNFYWLTLGWYVPL